ncbi:MAG: flagellar protein [Lachnospiraceae bacterium]|nr:flagellar protein [Lachnospiraceae bacterium]
MNRIGNQTYSMEQLAGEYLKQKKTPVTAGAVPETGSFQQVLKVKRESLEETLQTTGEVLFSKHANERLSSRNIHLTDAQMQRLNHGVEQARDKKINESLVMLDGLAFIVNVSNNTVITALDQGGETSHVFTNIDGAVII